MANLAFDRVRDTSTTTGTGTVTVSGTAPLTYRTLSTVYSINDQFDVVIVHRTLDEWEVVEATYSAANQFTRGRVYSSSNAGAAVNFSAGTKDVIVIPIAARAGRERLTADRTYYVRTDGNDSNTGLVNSAGGACLTIQAAFNIIAATLDVASYTVTISVGAGTFADGVTVPAWVGGGSIIVSGAGATTIISVTSGHCFNMLSPMSGNLTLDQMKLTTTGGGGGSCILVGGVGCSVYVGAVEFGACVYYHMAATGIGSFIYAYANYTISGGALAHVSVDYQSQMSTYGITITVSGTPAWGTAFALAANLGLILFDATTISGSATGKRYQGTMGAGINTNGGGANYFPGNSAGTVATDAWYN